MQFADEKASHVQGIFWGAAWLQRFGVWELQKRSEALVAWRGGTRPGGTGRRARGSHLGRGDSLRESSQEPEGRRGSGTGRLPSLP